MRWLRWSGVVALGSCVLPELVSVDAGMCPEVIDNQWPTAATLAEDLPIPGGTPGYTIGQVPPDFGLVDQYGDTACLRQFQGRYVVLDASALWCSPCQDIARALPCVHEAYDDQVVYVTLINQGISNGVAAVADDARKWAGQFELPTPVVADQGEVFTSRFPGDGLPSFLLLDPTQRVIASAQGRDGEPEIHAELARRIGISVSHCHGAVAE